ncbi:MAG: hypothetical protein MUP82_00735 [Candidatus Marinimicrobia bacterium]|nr:hypothetical protein [Candidatus Neomarinimicrobiota bacterium]
MTTPGMVYPTQKAMLAGNPQASALAQMQNSSNSQAKANAAMAGGKMRKRYRGGTGVSNNADTIVAPQMRTMYTPQGGTGTNPNDQMKGNAATSTQMAANSVSDNAATQRGGSRRKRKGGNPDWLWGCMSGGKQRSKKNSKRSRKSRKSKKSKKRRH